MRKLTVTLVLMFICFNAHSQEQETESDVDQDLKNRNFKNFITASCLQNWLKQQCETKKSDCGSYDIDFSYKVINFVRKCREAKYQRKLLEDKNIQEAIGNAVQKILLPQ